MPIFLQKHIFNQASSYSTHKSDRPNNCKKGNKNWMVVGVIGVVCTGKLFISVYIV